MRGYFQGALANVYRGTGGAMALVMYDVFQYKLMEENSSVAKRFLSGQQTHHDDAHTGGKDSDVRFFRYLFRPCKILKDRCVFCNF
jgi:hypothetical protein